MTLFFNDAQMKVAGESYAFWRSKANHLHSCALLADEAGETGFIWKLISGKMATPAGDHGMAEGAFQEWPARRADILKHTGLDVGTGTHLDMLRGAYAEMTESWSPYRHVWPALEATTTLWAAVNVLVRNYERSANPSSDDVKRAAIATYVDHVFKDESA